MPTSSYKAGDIVKAADGSFFRSIKDRYVSSSVDWSGYSPITGFASAIGGQGWSNGIPEVSFIQGRAYQMDAKQVRPSMVDYRILLFTALQTVGEVHQILFSDSKDSLGRNQIIISQIL